MQYTECYCGETYGKHGMADEADCNSPCAGDMTETCGGFFRNSIYETGKIS